MTTITPEDRAVFIAWYASDTRHNPVCDTNGENYSYVIDRMNEAFQAALKHARQESEARVKELEDFMINLQSFLHEGISTPQDRQYFSRRIMEFLARGLP